jgi:PIN domain nuclease of toxin-antitoxin system
MKLLLDTHTFLWFIGDHPQLSKTAHSLLEADHDILLSTASLWEMAIKIQLGKLKLDAPYETFIPEQLKANDIQELSITLNHLMPLVTLPLYHKDPFDRLLISQSIVEKIPIISVDTAFDDYDVERLW